MNISKHIDYLKNPKRWVADKLAEEGYTSHDREIRRNWIYLEKEVEIRNPGLLSAAKALKDFCVKNNIKFDKMRSR